MRGWLASLERFTAGMSLLERAVVGGFFADRLGLAFAAGYGAALRALVPSLTEGVIAGLCATEAGGAHPSSIATLLRRDATGAATLDGSKTFATLADEADVLFVVASEGRLESGKNRLRLVRVRTSGAGVRITRRPDLPFAPEIGHAEVVFHDAPVTATDVLPGDGYDVYLKPFRTIEDIHVHAACLGWLVGVAGRSGWPRAFFEQAAAIALGLTGAAALDPSAPEGHVALAGLLAQTQALVASSEAEWATVDAETRERWQRDRPLLGVAQAARGLRLAAAWRALGAGSEP